MCQARHKTAHPPVPYGRQNVNADPAKLVEEGFKQVRGALTEGRYLTFEMNGYALTNEGTNDRNLAIRKATPMHEDIHQRWILYGVKAQGKHTFNIKSALDSSYISANQTLTRSRDHADVFTINDLGNGNGYALSVFMSTSLAIDNKSELKKGFAELQILSINYSGGLSLVEEDIVRG